MAAPSRYLVLWCLICVLSLFSRTSLAQCDTDSDCNASQFCEICFESPPGSCLDRVAEGSICGGSASLCSIGCAAGLTCTSSVPSQDPRCTATATTTLAPTFTISTSLLLHTSSTPLKSTPQLTTDGSGASPSTTSIATTPATTSTSTTTTTATSTTGTTAPSTATTTTATSTTTAPTSTIVTSTTATTSTTSLPTTTGTTETTTTLATTTTTTPKLNTSTASTTTTTTTTTLNKVPSVGNVFVLSTLGVDDPGDIDITSQADLDLMESRIQNAFGTLGTVRILDVRLASSRRANQILVDYRAEVKQSDADSAISVMTSSSFLGTVQSHYPGSTVTVSSAPALSTPSTTVSTTTAGQQSSGSTGSNSDSKIIIGVVIGVVGGLILIVLIIFAVMRYRKSTLEFGDQPPNGANATKSDVAQDTNTAGRFKTIDFNNPSYSPDAGYPKAGDHSVV